jgi:CBS-domain-containing membrane protein
LIGPEPLAALQSRRESPVRIAALAASMFGASAAMCLMWWLCDLSGTSVAAVPFTTSIVVVFGAPASPLASSRSIVGGHLICSAVTLALVSLFGCEAWVAAVGLGLGTGAMLVTRTFHPPAGINAMIIVLNQLGWSYLLMPVGIGAVLIALVAFLFGRVTLSDSK